jgi:hypothetical protein
MKPVSVTVGTAYEDGVFTLGLANEDGVGALLFSRSDTIDEQDALLGMDTYSVSTDDGATLYGGVESARVTGLDLELRFTSEAADVLGVPRELLLRFEDGSAVDVARRGLRRVGIAARST